MKLGHGARHQIPLQKKKEKTNMHEFMFRTVMLGVISCTIFVNYFIILNFFFTIFNIISNKTIKYTQNYTYMDVNMQTQNTSCSYYYLSYIIDEYICDVKT